MTERVVGAYRLSVWADPDATDDGSAGGQFWVVLQPANKSAVLPSSTRAGVSIRPLDRTGPSGGRSTEPVGGDPARQFAALPMDHEGPFSVHVSVDGPLGKADVAADVDATYDLRPAPALLFVYLVPFLLIGFLWAKLLLRRRQMRTRR